MTRLKKILRGTTLGFLASSLAHAALAGSLYYGIIVRKPDPIVAELDLSLMPMIPMKSNPGNGYGVKPEKRWTLPKKEKALVPKSTPIIETIEEVIKQKNQITACPEPCSESQNGTDLGGKTGESEGATSSASQAFRKPKWIKNFITPQDYPAIARQEGKDGRVVLTILINAEGRVKDARLSQGSYEVLNKVALKKVKQALFTPAYNQENQPVSCKVTLPIRFKLND